MASTDVFGVLAVDGDGSLGMIGVRLAPCRRTGYRRRGSSPLPGRPRKIKKQKRKNIKRKRRRRVRKPRENQRVKNQEEISRLFTNLK